MKSEFQSHLVLAAMTFILTACGSPVREGPSIIPANLPEVGTKSEDGMVLRSRAVITISTEAPTLSQLFFRTLLPSALAATGAQTVTVVNSPNSSITLDASGFIVSSVSNTVLDFGFLTISNLLDNNLSVCGTGGKTKCGNALIRIYTSGVAGAGLWNTGDGYGAPLSAALQNTTPSGTVGLGILNSLTLQTQAIAASKHVLRQTDFAVTPKYNVKSDFTDAGSGNYSTTLVIDYGLSL